jgi:hypothetical protein
MDYKAWIDITIKALALIGVYIAAINYRSQRIIKKGEWLKSLFEKFYENATYKEVRRWLDNKELEIKINSDDNVVSDEDEKFTDFLNFFEFIANLEQEKQITKTDAINLFDYYLQQIKRSPVCMEWIKKYGFEKLDGLLNKIK